MKYTIIATGSGGNCSVAEFSDGKKIVFDMGKGTFAQFCKQGFKVEEITAAFCSHKHSDHFGDFHKIDVINGFMKDNGLSVFSLPVNHDVDCKMIFVENPALKEIFIYATDFSSLPEKTENYLIGLCNKLSKTSYKIFAVIELNYCEFLLKKLPVEMQYGSLSHFSDEKFYALAKKLLAANKEIRIVSTHASQRKAGNGAGWDGTVCPADYVKSQFVTRLKTNRISFGEARGSVSPYYF